MKPATGGHRRHRWPEALGLFALALAAAGCGAGAPGIAVVMTEFAFDPQQINVRAGQRTTITLQNKGTAEHNFAVSQLNVASPPVAAGQTATVEIAAPPGNYRLVCTVPGHEEAGMVGQVTVARR